ncbi:hypothetical protein BGZ49_007219 [Haplosporangium sp. Z 27]|nr:hypothetical protein BGZ49_007219 [Haplosporangium sp. Z 27]
MKAQKNISRQNNAGQVEDILLQSIQDDVDTPLELSTDTMDHQPTATSHVAIVHQGFVSFHPQQQQPQSSFDPQTMFHSQSQNLYSQVQAQAEMNMFMEDIHIPHTTQAQSHIPSYPPQSHADIVNFMGALHISHDGHSQQENEDL